MEAGTGHPGEGPGPKHLQSDAPRHSKQEVLQKLRRQEVELGSGNNKPLDGSHSPSGDKRLVVHGFSQGGRR